MALPGSRESRGVCRPVNPATATSRGALVHTVGDLVAVFDALFSRTENTRLVAGGEEPVYLPADASCAYHRIVFTRDYFASALHEVAHWCIAGSERRQRLDYGYWYAPDGRDAARQRAFEQVEVRPQALEWLFANACGARFRVSVDNIDGEDTDPTPFRCAVYRQVRAYCAGGIPPRAQLFRDALARDYGTGRTLCVDTFDPGEIGLERGQWGRGVDD